MLEHRLAPLFRPWHASGEISKGDSSDSDGSGSVGGSSSDSDGAGTMPLRKLIGRGRSVWSS